MSVDAGTAFELLVAGHAGPRPRYAIINRYAAGEFLFGFIICFLFFFAVFFVNNFLLMAEEILSKKAPFADVLLLLLYAMPRVLAMAFPFAALVGALMAAGRFSSDNEALALMASGVPPVRVFAPFMLLGLCISLVSFSMNDYFIPRGNLEFEKLFRKLAASTPALELKAWSTKTYDKITVVTAEVKGEVLTDVLIFDQTEAGTERVISAGSAQLKIDDTRGDVILYLNDVWQQVVRKGENDRFEWAKALDMVFRIGVKGSEATSSAKGPGDMTARDLAAVIEGKASALEAKRRRREEDIGKARTALAEAYSRTAAQGAAWQNSADLLKRQMSAVASYGTSEPTDRMLDVYRMEYHKKYSIPFGALCFIVLAFPVGMLARKAGRATGFGIGILVSVLYWAMLVGGTSLSSRLRWSPFWSAWTPNFVILAAGLVFWIRRRTSR
jgi:lipopolysaccharide export system permease protein